MGKVIPKQFLEFGGKPILRHTLERFQKSCVIDRMVLVLASEFVDEYCETIRHGWGIDKIAAIVAGGSERHHSVLAGLAAAGNAEIIMIHDGVRPFVTERILRDSVEAARRCGGAVAALHPKDTIKLTDYPDIIETLDRRRLVQAQTPQTFRAKIIRDAYRRAAERGVFSTDDAALVEQAGGTVVVVEGDWRNIKITSPEDLLIAEAFWHDEHSHRSRL